MNNKGFTLVELLATIVILGIIMGIATYGVINAINTSKLKSEKIFVDKIETAVQGYLSYYGSTLEKLNDSTRILAKSRTTTDTCTKSTCNNKNCECVNIWELQSIKLTDITKTDLKTINADDLINPKNKTNCVNGKDPTIRIFKDEKSVYYYIINLSGNKTSCEISNENSIVSNILSYAKNDSEMCTNFIKGNWIASKGCVLN